ncbi:hypothetical protein FOL47_004736 [Perkinsus chesapeaki]|uniref:TLC domain-containing protein n=1 Tax=Perkinsus chesapeaki TaxID=330153 RepID=A0A7J6M267_PERCH|nr:hypothetical protein FOL47_004736 [Perkinsus chesapeaki]
MLSLLWFILPAKPATHSPQDLIYGPITVKSITINVIEMTLLASLLGFVLLRSKLLPESWKKPHEKAKKYSRTSAELVLVAVHNALVVLMCLIAANASTRTSRNWWALHAFSFEIGYEVFDLVNTNRRLSPDALIHHICSPVAILTSAFTSTNVNLLLHLAICMDFSGAWLALCKLVSRHHAGADEGKRKSSHEYRRMLLVYLPCRVILPTYDIALILEQLCYLDNPFGTWSLPPDWTRPYIWSMSVLMAFNGYFCWMLVKKAFPGRFPQAQTGHPGNDYDVPLRDRLVGPYDPAEDYTIIESPGVAV